MRNHNKIVLDLEFNPIRDKELREFARHEIIEIGAVKLNDDLEVIDKFDILVKPQYNMIEEKITQITGITNEKVAGCDDFNGAMYKFMDFIGDEPYNLYSWSLSDMDVMLDEIELKCPDDPAYDKFFVHWTDLQRIYGRIMGFNKSMGLTYALGALKIKFDGNAHGALDDAINTANVMRVITDKEKMEKFRSEAKISFNNKGTSQGFSMGDILNAAMKKADK